MLYSKDRKFHFDLRFQSVLDASHEGWISYSLTLETNDSRRFVFESTNDSPLFLDTTIEPEVPALCHGIRDVVRLGGSYVFEPIDERDFTLRIEVDDCCCTLHLTIPDKPVPSEFGWGDGVDVDIDELLIFVDELQQHYQALAGSF